MSDSPTIDALLAELEPLRGARIQRIDRIDPHTWVFEMRLPGRTLRLLVSMGVGRRLHLVAARPPRKADGGDEQRRLRKRVVGRFVVELIRTSSRLTMRLSDVDLHFEWSGTRSGLLLEPHDPLPPPDVIQIPDRFPLNEQAAAVGEADSDTSQRRHEVEAVLRSLRKRRKKQARTVANIQRDIERMAAIAEKQHDGELLKTVLGQVTKGMASVEVFDWRSSETRQLELRPDLGPKANLEWLFRQSKRGRRGLSMAQARKAEQVAVLEGLDQQIRSLEQADPMSDLSDLLPSRVSTRSSTKAKQPIDRWARRFVAVDGAEILVGKGAKENDRLTLSVARAHDRWLHARGVTGAHVVVRCEPGREPSSESVLDAAHLAIHYSSLRGESRADVIVAEARHVKKTKGAAPGSVGVSRSRTLHVVVEEDRLRRLRDSVPDYDAT